MTRPKPKVVRWIFIETRTDPVAPLVVRPQTVHRPIVTSLGPCTLSCLNKTLKGDRHLLLLLPIRVEFNTLTTTEKPRLLGGVLRNRHNTSVRSKVALSPL